MQPLVSIVTPVYNGEKYLENTIKSVIAQDYNNIEYYIIDGNSYDKTVKIVKKYVSENIKLIINKNHTGMYSNLKLGFNMCKGKYLTWINSDDLLFKNAISNSVKLMEENNYNWITGIPSYIKNEKIFSLPFAYRYPQKIIQNKLAYKCAWGYIQQESTIFSRKLYLDSGGINDKLKYAGDFELWVNFSKISKLYSVDFKIGAFRKRKGQISEDQKRYLNEVNLSTCYILNFTFLRLIYSFLKWIFNERT